MARQTITIALITAAAVLAGCVDRDGASQPATGPLGFLFVASGGTQRPLKAENYPQAFGHARAVVSQYFTIASADQGSGLIQCLPKPLSDAPADRLIGGSPTRQVATLEVVRRSGRMFAVCSVQLQRRSSAILRQQSLVDETYDSVPNQTPGEVEAATTPDQNDTWETCGSDSALENKILNDLEQALLAAGS